MAIADRVVWSVELLSITKRYSFVSAGTPESRIVKSEEKLPDTSRCAAWATSKRFKLIFPGFSLSTGVLLSISFLRLLIKVLSCSWTVSFAVLVEVLEWVEFFGAVGVALGATDGETTGSLGDASELDFGAKGGGVGVEFGGVDDRGCSPAGFR